MNNDFNKTINWFLPIRLAQYVILFLVVIFWMKYPEYIQLPFILYSLFTLGFSVLLAIKRYRKYQILTTTLIGLQFVFELIIEAGVVYFSGGINSPFTALFILTIILAAFNFRLVGTLLITSATSVAYTFVIWLSLFGEDKPVYIKDAFKTIISSQDYIFYTVFLHVLIFFLVAFLAGFLVDKLRKSDLELKDASIALKQAKLETDDILRHMNSGLLSIDLNGKIIYFNRAAEKILGYLEHDVKGLSCTDVFDERMPTMAECLMEAVNQGTEHPRKEIIISNKAKLEIPIGFSTSILIDEHYRKRGVIAIFSDLTDVKKLESKVRSADRLAAIGELSASIAHEIRNPLAAIAGSVELLNRDLALSADNEKLMNLIVKESDRLTNILNEFLTYAKIDRPAYNKVELCHIITEIMEIISHHPAYHKNLQIEFESELSFVNVFGDENLIKQLLINLGVNACEAMGDQKGVIKFILKPYQSTGHVELLVVDNGPGMDQNIINEIFQPFFSTKKEGTGLGLAIVHRICTAMKLPLSVNSNSYDGSEFKIIFTSVSSAPTTDNKVSVS